MAAGWQTNRESGHCIQDEQGRRLVDWVLVGVGDLLRFPLVAKEREEWRREERREWRSCIATVCPTFFLCLRPCGHTHRQLFPYTHAFTQYSTVQYSILSYTFSSCIYYVPTQSVHVESTLLLLHNTYKLPGSWLYSLYSTKAVPYNLEPMLS